MHGVHCFANLVLSFLTQNLRHPQETFIEPVCRERSLQETRNPPRNLCWEIPFAPHPTSPTHPFPHLLHIKPLGPEPRCKTTKGLAGSSPTHRVTHPTHPTHPNPPVVPPLLSRHRGLPPQLQQRPQRAGDQRRDLQRQLRLQRLRGRGVAYLAAFGESGEGQGRASDGRGPRAIFQVGLLKEKHIPVSSF